MDSQQIGRLVLLCLIISSCSLHETAFDRVVREYECDSLKYEAALYLKKHGGLHHGVARHLVDSAGNAIIANLAEFNSDSSYVNYLKKLGGHVEAMQSVEDLENISEDFLKDNIELAFSSWSNPWSRQVSFHDFCKYILPYRNMDEELTEWRRMLKERYEPSIIDSVSNPESLKEVAEYVMREIRRDIHYSTILREIYENFLTPEEMLKIGGLECRACAHYTTLAMRACGIPCSMIELHWRFTEVPHTSVMVPAVGKNERAFRINVGDTLIYMGEPKDTMATWRTWAYNYEANPDLVELAKDNHVPSVFVHPLTREDITPKVSTTYDITVPIPDGLHSYKHIFLCRFDSWRWYVIREGTVYGDIAKFNNATIRQWYRMGVIADNQVQTFGDTFTILGDGRVQKYDLTGDTVLFKRVFGCQADERRLRRNVTTYYWGADNEWCSLTQEAILWGYNDITGEYRIFDESMRGTFKPVFHLMQTHLPCWTVFTDSELPRPLGFIVKDPETGEGYLMQF